jgi:hypothetical protein
MHFDNLYVSVNVNHAFNNKKAGLLCVTEVHAEDVYHGLLLKDVSVVQVHLRFRSLTQWPYCSCPLDLSESALIGWLGF